MCGLTDLDRFDMRKSHINVYLASQKKVSHQKMLSETKEHCTFYTNTNKALTFSNCLQVFTSNLLLTGTKQNHCFEILS